MFTGSCGGAVSAEAAIETGVRVRVVKVENLVLTVVPVDIHKT